MPTQPRQQQPGQPDPRLGRLLWGGPRQFPTLQPPGRADGGPVSVLHTRRIAAVLRLRQNCARLSHRASRERLRGKAHLRSVTLKQRFRVRLLLRRDPDDMDFAKKNSYRLPDITISLLTSRFLSMEANVDSPRCARTLCSCFSYFEEHTDEPKQCRQDVICASGPKKKTRANSVKRLFLASQRR